MKKRIGFVIFISMLITVSIAQNPVQETYPANGYKLSAGNESAITHDNLKIQIDRPF
ncbi:MAG: hypothetical protein K9H64_20030 [Bacteroidales bacterium]|nr:hypothetical protein [Bacteroidales bacterium]MCF8458358.1 hypothetical protein [Bacteroidales bacterium]